MPTYSIIICTYNPDERLLTRCLDAVKKLDGLGSCEILLVDNNSSPTLVSYDSVKNALLELPNLHVIVEREQGLNYARKAGVMKANGAFVVFFDDDNEPQQDYLVNLSSLISKYPSVGAWGPGNVWTEFIDGVDVSIRRSAEKLFQEKHDDFLAFSCVRRWEDCYPYGTGLCIRKVHAMTYVQMLDSGSLTLKGREGEQLTSGDDVQLVLCCILSGEAAGRCPSLKIKHLIPGKRANFNYLKKLVYGMHVCYDIAIKQIFPEYSVNFGKPLKRGVALYFKIYSRLWRAKLVAKPEKLLQLIEYVSLLASSYLALGRSVPKVVRRFLKRYANQRLN